MTNKNEVQTTVRLPADLNEQFKQAATEDERSFNKMIVKLIKDYLKTKQPNPAANSTP